MKNPIIRIVFVLLITIVLAGCPMLLEEFFGEDGELADL